MTKKSEKPESDLYIKPETAERKEGLSFKEALCMLDPHAKFGIRRPGNCDQWGDDVSKWVWIGTLVTDSNNLYISQVVFRNYGPDRGWTVQIAPSYQDLLTVGDLEAHDWIAERPLVKISPEKNIRLFVG